MYAVVFVLKRYFGMQAAYFFVKPADAQQARTATTAEYSRRCTRAGQQPAPMSSTPFVPLVCHARLMQGSRQTRRKLFSAVLC
eukprot:932129-Pyramimonas_sp.AAC.2